MPTAIDINTELYQPILKSLDVTPREHGTLWRSFLGQESVCELSKRTVMLPLPDVLKNLNNEKQIAFHPMCENVARGDSPIYKLLKQLVTMRVSITAMMLIKELADILADPNKQERLKDAQLDILTEVGDLDEKGLAKLDEILTKVDLKTVKLFNVYNRRNGKVDDKNYNRVAVVTFPLLEDIVKHKEGSLAEIKSIRVRDLKVFTKLFNYIIPNWDLKNTYSGVSDSMEAPSFSALISCYVKVMNQLNKVTKTFADFIESADALQVDLSYADVLNDLGRYRNLIPPLDGNVGSVESEAKSDVQRQPRAVPPAAAAPMNVPSFNIGQGINATQPPVVEHPQQPEPLQPQQQMVTHQPVSQQQMVPQPHVGQPPQHYATAPMQQNVNPFAAYTTPSFAQPTQHPVGYDAYGRPIFQQMNAVPQQQMGTSPQPINPLDAWALSSQPQMQNAYGQFGGYPPMNPQQQPFAVQGQPMTQMQVAQQQPVWNGHPQQPMGYPQPQVFGGIAPFKTKG